MNADGSNQAQLTSMPSGVYALAPTWSPDGARIAFERGADIWLMNADGSGQANITADLHLVATTPAWSPDGTRIAFTGTDEQSDIWVIRPDGTGLANLTNTPRGVQERWPDWSPDGSRLTFSRLPATQIYTINADGTGASFVTTGGRPAWSPDGTKITFDDPNGVFTVNTDGSQRTFVRSGQLPDWQPVRLAPQRGDYKNAAAFCRAERDFLGEREFAQRYGKNDNGANAFGQCVSRNN